MEPIDIINHSLLLKIQELADKNGITFKEAAARVRIFIGDKEIIPCSSETITIDFPRLEKLKEDQSEPENNHPS